MIRRILIAGVIALSLAPRAQAQTAASASPLDNLLNRASATSPGTYVVTASSIEPASSNLPVVVQADTLRGTDRTRQIVRVPIAIGANVPASASVRLRIVTAGTATPRVVGNANGSGPAGQLRLVHDFSLAPGKYEIQAAVGYRQTGSGLIAALAKNSLTVPDVWNTPLAVTPVVIGDGVIPAQRSGAQPFAFGATTLSPAVQTAFPQQGEIDVAFRVFNWTADPATPGESKPDLTVEYAFFQQNGARKRVFFNKMKPQRLTADTLGSTFDFAAGMVAAGMRIPLVAFPYGDFDLRVRVTDNRNSQTTEQNVSFTVAP
jgi:hypothetical protein